MVARMPRRDLNLLVTLDALLAEGSVARAARRLRLSPSAMSRALARLRAATGDPLLIRAGRGLVPTPRALELRHKVGPLVADAQAVLSPAEKLDLKRLARTFTLRTGDGFVETFGPTLIARIAAEAPGVHLRFMQKPDRDGGWMDDAVDLETGVVRETAGPDLRTQLLFRDRLVGAVRKGHPLSRGRITPARYAAGQHVDITRHVARDGRDPGPVDEALASAKLRRTVSIVVGGFSSALALVRASDLIATVPERHTKSLRAGMFSFALPVPTPEIAVSMLWHPRLDADPAHRWLRGCVRDACATGPRRPSQQSSSKITRSA